MAGRSPRPTGHGARVVYTDIDEAVPPEAAAEGAGALRRRLDVTSTPGIELTIDWIVATCGRLDVVENNAGVNTLEHRVTIDAFPREEWDRIAGGRPDGPLRGQPVRGPRRPAVRGRAASSTSRRSSAWSPLRLQCAFVASKAGVVNLTKAMALELGPHGILVNGIAPGSTLTEGTRRLFYAEGGLFHDSVKQMLAHIPLGRPAETSEIAVAALFLADPENSYMNGHILTVDGGWTAGYHREF